MREHEPLAARGEGALALVHVPVHREAVGRRPGGEVAPAAKVAPVDATVGADVAEEDAGREGELERAGPVDVLRVEVGVRDAGRQVDAEPDHHLVARAADDAHRPGLPGDQLVAPVLLVERPVREVRAQRRLGAQPEPVDQVRPDGGAGGEREVGGQRVHEPDTVAGRLDQVALGHVGDVATLARGRVRGGHQVDEAARVLDGVLDAELAPHGVGARLGEGARELRRARLLARVAGHEDEEVVGVEHAGLVVGGRLRPAGQRELPPAALVQLEGNRRRLALAEGEQAEARERRAAQVVELGGGHLERVVDARDRAARAERHGGIRRHCEAAARQQGDERTGTAHQPRSTAVRVGAASARRHAASTWPRPRRAIMRSVAASEGWSQAARLACASARSRRESARRAKR